MITGALKLNMQECQETSQKVLMATVQTVSREAVLYVCCEKPHYVGWATERSFARCANTRGGYRFSGYHDARAHVGGSRPAGMTNDDALAAVTLAGAAAAAPEVATLVVAADESCRWKMKVASRLRPTKLRAQ